jgi:hypothetical protein
MSHEIRTPMNAIIGLTHLLRRGAGRRPNRPSGWTRSTAPAAPADDHQRHPRPVQDRGRPGCNWKAPTSSVRRARQGSPIDPNRPAPRDLALELDGGTPSRSGCAATRPGCARRCSTMPATRSSSPRKGTICPARPLLEEAGETPAGALRSRRHRHRHRPRQSAAAVPGRSSRPMRRPRASTAAPASGLAITRRWRR